MAANIRNGDAEAWLLDIRVGRRASDEATEGKAGAFLVFPTSVVVAAQTGHSVYPLRTDVEPGSFVTAGGSARVSGRVAGITVTGSFHWVVGDGEAPPASYQFVLRGRRLAQPPPWADQLPPSQHLPCLSPRSVVLRCRQLRRRAREAEHRLLRASEGALHRDCGTPVQRALCYRPQVDEDDLVQRGLQSAWRLLPLYASRHRPPCSWLGMLRLDCRRDMHREISRLDWLPADAMAALTLAEGWRRHGTSDPGATWATVVAAFEGEGRPRPRIAPAPLCAALQAPGRLLHHLTTSVEPEDPNDPGRAVVAAVARLVTDDEDLVSSAVEGDPKALARLGRKVVRRLSTGHEALPAARNRCWDEFQRTGHLFAGPAGLAELAGAAGTTELAGGSDTERRDRLLALDHRLRRAAAIYRVAGPGRRPGPTVTGPGTP